MSYDGGLVVLTLLDVEKEIIHNIAKDLCGLFNQEPVLVTEDIVKGFYIYESEDRL